MKVIIIDDEKAMHLVMRKLLAKISDIEVVASFQDTNTASLFLETHSVQMAFVDISMPRETGMEFAKRIADRGWNLHVVFVTSHKEYALEAFDLFALDYIVKPITLDRLERTVRRAMAVHQFSKVEKEEPAEHQTSIYCLGGIEIRTSSGGGVKWRSRKSAELFSYLLLNRGRMVSRVRLTEAIFGDMPYKNAEAYLNTTIYQLRKSLEPHGLKSMVKSNNDSYGLEVKNAVVDFVEFEEGLKTLSLIDASNINQAIAVEEVFAGELFGERGFLWALNDIARISRLYHVFVKKLAAALLRHKEEDMNYLVVSIRILKKLLALNELDEESISLLMNAYAVQKDTVALTKLYSQYVRMLKKDLGIAPSPELLSQYISLKSKL